MERARTSSVNRHETLFQERNQQKAGTQLNAYISYFMDCEMVDGDNPPIGILLCTEKGPKMVQYVLNGMDENFLIKEVKEMGL